MTSEEARRVAAALLEVSAGAHQLEEAREALVRRIVVALELGADERAVAKAAGVEVTTVRTWLTAWRTGAR